MVDAKPKDDGKRPAKPRAKHGAHGSLIGSLSVALILALVGYMLTVNVRVNRTVTSTSNTAGLLEEREGKVGQLRHEINQMSSQIDALKNFTDSKDVSKVSEEAGSGTVLKAVRGPGVKVTLDDSNLWQQKVDATGSSVNINDYVIHQQDVEAVVNALWAGGAESMQIQDQRVLPTSAVRCVGNVLLLHGRKYSPPFTIAAIGPVNRMTDALDDSPSVSIYKEYVATLGLGWKLERSDKIEFPQATSMLQPLQYATVDEKVQQ
ncbi:membrane protein [Bombiscardovia nodaiensis]|uniref:Membrane protein n=1 Tax=Bombiscardovia nodaiensis TaxID=2932181 RepID=A0ABN6SBH3_9BIFI|nr:membrane protein [Bombiscardovia nodaiensis]